ncbi:MAG: UPF0149 family protein [Gammaproteobacteria bacterium]
MLNYRELNEMLRLTRSGSRAADCHGFLCGQVCVSETPEAGAWEEYLDMQPDDEVLVQEFLEEIDNLFLETRKLIVSPYFDFQLLLPDDDSPLPDRAKALGEWCHGFLNGFGIGKNTDVVLADAESRELLENFTRICRIGVSESTDEGDERALFELVEYVRMGAIYIFDQLHADPGSSKPETYH